MLYDSTLILDENGTNLNIDLFRLKSMIDGTICLYVDDKHSVCEVNNDLASIIEILTKYDYVCKVKKEVNDDTISIIEYCHDEAQDSWGCPNLMWVNQEEAEMISQYREDLAQNILEKDYELGNCAML